MKKKLLFDNRAEKELRKFSQKVQVEFEAYFIILKQEGRLSFPESKKIDRNLYELRIKYKGEYRGFYGYIGRNYIIILHFFVKKSKKTPLRNLKTAKRRLKQYE